LPHRNNCHTGTLAVYKILAVYNRSGGGNHTQEASAMMIGEIEAALRARGLSCIAGVDEVGRGPLAGPVVAAAVILPENFDGEGITDSKALSPARREALAARITRQAATALAYVPAPEIDRLNIHGATLLAMRRAVLALPIQPVFVLADGKFTPKDLPCPAQAVVKGDARVLAIAAASIVAKVARDRLMATVEIHFPGYAFAKNAGYPTSFHKNSLKKIGLTPLHRLSFAPCKALLG